MSAYKSLALPGEVQVRASFESVEPISFLANAKAVAISAPRVSQYKPIYKAMVIWALQMPQYEALALLGDDAGCFVNSDHVFVKVRGVPILLDYRIRGSVHAGCSLDVCTVPHLSERTQSAILGSWNARSTSLELGAKFGISVYSYSCLVRFEDDLVMYQIGPLVVISMASIHAGPGVYYLRHHLPRGDSGGFATRKSIIVLFGDSALCLSTLPGRVEWSTWKRLP